MAFKLPVTAGCDEPGCACEITVHAVSEEAAAAELRKQGWDAWQLVGMYKYGTRCPQYNRVR